MNEMSLKPQDDKITATPYQSPIITLVVGPNGEGAARFFVHKDKLINIPFFAAALRENAFIEGKQLAIYFEEEDPAYFERVLEFIYESDCFPRWKSPVGDSHSLEKVPTVQSITADCLQEPYTSFSSYGVSSGIYTSTKETHELFSSVLQLLCVAERYGIEALMENCFRKLKIFPIGTKEVALLAQQVLSSIPESRTEIHAFVAKQVQIQLPRLNDCYEFQSLLEKEMSTLGQGVARLFVNAAATAQANQLLNITQICKALNNRWKIALCCEGFTVERCIDQFGKDDDYPIKFGAAKAGDIIISDGKVDHRGIITAQRELDGPKRAYPCQYFKVFGGV